MTLKIIVTNIEVKQAVADAILERYGMLVPLEAITLENVHGHGVRAVYERTEAEMNKRAEADVERLKLMVKSITEGLDEAIETVYCLEAENALLHKVADAAREFWKHCVFDIDDDPQGTYEPLQQALAELDKAKEGQDG